MGASNSRMVEEDKALLLCRERKKFIGQALDGRCNLAATHITYIENLKLTGTSLWTFVEPEGPLESSIYTSTSATPEPLVQTDKSVSQFSFSSPSFSQGNGNISPSSTPPSSNRYHTNHMKFRGTFSRKVEEKASVPQTVSVASGTPQSTTPRSVERPETPVFETSDIQDETAPWDYFGLFHPVENHYSTQEQMEFNQNSEYVDEVGGLKEGGISEPEGEDEKLSSHKRAESLESEDEFDEPSTDTLVRSFENVNRVGENVTTIDPTAMPSTESVASESKVVKMENNSPDLTPLRETSSGAEVANDVKPTPIEESEVESKIASKDFFSSMKDIEYLFVKASESGKEVPRMLEANKFHFRPIFAGKENGSVTSSSLLKSCFSCGEDPSEVQEEPPETSMKYLTWHRTTSSRSASSRNLLGVNPSDDVEDLTKSLLDSLSMVSRSHASTLDRLYAWEKKLYDEVKASLRVRKKYDSMCRLLRQQESKGEKHSRIEKTRAVVKDLHSRIKVAIHRIDSVSKKIEDLRDTELQPQLEELIEGLRRMWEVMLDCHKLQFHVISVAYTPTNIKISFQSDSRRQITIELENNLNSLSSSFTKWIGAQKAYVEAINKWLFKCVPQTKTSSKKKKGMQPPRLRNFGPPIYVTCGVWLDNFNNLRTKAVADSMKSLAAEISHFLPRQEKNQGKHGGGIDTGANLLRNEAVEEQRPGLDQFRVSLAGFLGQLSNYAEFSVNMFAELQREIEKAKSSYELSKSQEK